MTYSEAFLALWKIHPYGSKAQAFYEFTKAVLPTNAAEILGRQSSAAIAAERDGDPSLKLPHLCRWIKYRRWEDEPQSRTTSTALKTSAFLTELEKHL